MQTTRRQFIATFALLPAAASCALAQTAVAQHRPIVRLRGQLICLTEALQKEFQVEPICSLRGHVFALKTSAQTSFPILPTAAPTAIWPILPTDAAAAIWLDERYRQLDLQIVARTFPHTAHIEVIKYQVWRGTQLFDAEYYCSVCNISTHKPEACVCCQDPVVYREIPVENS